MNMEEKAKKIAELLKILANENRLLILCQLIDGPKTVSRLAEGIPGITQSALSQHLSMMRTEGLVTFRRDGQTLHYSIANPVAERLLSTLREIYC